MAFITRALKCAVFLVTLSLGFVCTSSAQQMSRLYRHSIKFSPLHVVNPELASIQLAYEYRFAQEFSVQVEGGYVFGDVWWTRASSEAKGFKLKQDIRWYFKNNERVKPSGKTIANGFYVALEAHQNRITFINDDREVYRQRGLGVKTGFIRYATWGFVLDLNVGLTFAHANMFPLGIPLNDPNEVTGIGRNSLLPIIGVRLGHVIR